MVNHFENQRNYEQHVDAIATEYEDQIRENPNDIATELAIGAVSTAQLVDGEATIQTVGEVWGDAITVDGHAIDPVCQHAVWQHSEQPPVSGVDGENTIDKIAVTMFAKDLRDAAKDSL